MVDYFVGVTSLIFIKITDRTKEKNVVVYLLKQVL